jgi:hypothetical protein
LDALACTSMVFERLATCEPSVSVSLAHVAEIVCTPGVLKITDVSRTP